MKLVAKAYVKYENDAKKHIVHAILIVRNLVLTILGIPWVVRLNDHSFMMLINEFSSFILFMIGLKKIFCDFLFLSQIKDCFQTFYIYSSNSLKFNGLFA
jgi:hypothetical protein